MAVVGPESRCPLRSLVAVTVAKHAHCHSQLLEQAILKSVGCLDAVALPLTERLLHGEDSRCVECGVAAKSGSASSQPIIGHIGDFTPQLLAGAA